MHRTTDLILTWPMVPSLMLGTLDMYTNC
jgi:hypothetical protein